MSLATLQPTSMTTCILGQSTEDDGHPDDAPSGGGLAAPFASTLLVGLLRLLLARPDSGFCPRELAGLAGSRLTRVQRDLRRLGGAGLVARRRHGGRAHYRACGAHPACADPQAVLAKTAGGAETPHDPLPPLLDDAEPASV